eukprot:6199056-Pleurochrysis_carterae.AAC.1
MPYITKGNDRRIRTHSTPGGNKAAAPRKRYQRSCWSDEVGAAGEIVTCRPGCRAPARLHCKSSKRGKRKSKRHICGAFTNSASTLKNTNE